MFGKILIANRGEIACRVLRTARRLGIRCAAVYSDADAGALHVESADEAYRIGPPPARESYLSIPAIMAAVRRSGAEAVHPGYGFLAENADFADACAAAGVAFIGPPAAAIRAMGSKSAAKSLMAAAGVPLVPGYHGDAQDDRTLSEAAARLGYPLMIKAWAGGGGKGMRRVDTAESFPAALAACRREAAAAFGDDRVLIERYLEAARHIEVQVFADAHGAVVHLFERDCSVQRRHQKVLEEAPAPGMTEERRARMGAAAVAAARSVGYVGAGTVEFIAERDGFYFMEMNTRLQVEHPVTEMITGLDLVEWQLRVASGEPLPKTQPEIEMHGHAVEARIYAEDPSRGFLPVTGHIERLRVPAESGQVRLDTGVRSGDDITPFYDPMIGKLVAAGRDRAEALGRLRQALGEMAVVGTTTNLEFLERLLRCGDFTAGRLDTALIERNAAALLQPHPGVPPAALAIALCADLEHVRRQASKLAQASGDPCSPWHLADGWRLNAPALTLLRLRAGGTAWEAALRPDGRGAVAVQLLGEPGSAQSEAGSAQSEAGGQSFTFSGTVDGDRVKVRLGDVFHAGVAVRGGNVLHVSVDGARHRFTEIESASAAEQESAQDLVAAPMPGRIIAVMAVAGARVEKGTPLLVLEAMKMEHTITAAGSATVKSVRFKVGDQVQEGATLVEFDAAGAAAP